jgi:hypothetical protein
MLLRADMMKSACTEGDLLAALDAVQCLPVWQLTDLSAAASAAHTLWSQYPFRWLHSQHHLLQFDPLHLHMGE